MQCGFLCRDFRATFSCLTIISLNPSSEIMMMLCETLQLSAQSDDVTSAVIIIYISMSSSVSQRCLISTPGFTVDTESSVILPSCHCLANNVCYQMRMQFVWPSSSSSPGHPLSHCLSCYLPQWSHSSSGNSNTSGSFDDFLAPKGAQGVTIMNLFLSVSVCRTIDSCSFKAPLMGFL